MREAATRAATVRVIALAGAVVLALGLSACADEGTSDSTGGARAGVPTADGDVAQVTPMDAAPRYRIRNAWMDLRVEDPDEVAAVADQTVAVVEDLGGIVDGDQRSYGGGAKATLRLRVPPDELEEAIRRVGALGEVTASNITTEDVTEEYTDVEGRVATLEAGTARIRELIAQAENINDIAALEAELVQREAELERAKGALRLLDEQVGMGTLEVTISADAVEEPADEGPPSPADALSTGWSSFVNVLAWSLATLLVLLPFLVAGTVVALGLRSVGRAWRRRHPTRPHDPWAGARAMHVPPAAGPQAWPPPSPDSPAPGQPAPAATDPEPGPDDRTPPGATPGPAR